MFFINSLISREHLPHLLLYKKKIIVAFRICDQSNHWVTRFLNMLVWYLLSPGRWKMKSSWIGRKTLNLIFSTANFRLTGVYLLSSICRTLHNVSTGFSSMHRGILVLKIDTSILRKSSSFANKTAVFVKTKIYFCRWNFANKQINRNF